MLPENELYNVYLKARESTWKRHDTLVKLGYNAQQIFNDRAYNQLSKKQSKAYQDWASAYQQQG